MLRAVGAAFGLPVRDVDKAVLLASLEAFLCQLAVAKKRALLVVDEPPNLPNRPVEEWRILSNFQLGHLVLVQTLVGVELGPESRLDAVWVVEDTNDSTTDLALPSRAETKMCDMHFEKLEERIERLERTVGAAVQLLHRLLHPDKAATKPGKPAGR